MDEGELGLIIYKNSIDTASQFAVIVFSITRARSDVYTEEGKPTMSDEKELNPSAVVENVDQIQLDGLDLSELSLEGLEITALGDAMNVPEMGASSGVSSCTSCSCCASTSCCSISFEQAAE
jgi:thiazolylpeptide-type bacteriocin precursor